MPRVQHRRGTASALASVNPTPLAGELVWESDTNRIKIGNGTSTYTTLSYVGVNTTITATGGSVSSPAIVFSTDTDTGFYRAAENTVAIACGGVERFKISGVAMIVNSNAMLFGASASRSAGPTDHPRIQLEGTTAGDCSIQCIAGSTSAAVAPLVILARQRGGAGDSTVVASGDTLGTISFHGGDGTDCVTPAAQIVANVDGTPGSNDMPGRLTFLTTADGASTATERVRITSAGLVGIATASPTATLDVSADTIRLRTARTPASASAAGNAGDICWDASFLYIAVAANTWRRIAHSSW